MKFACIYLLCFVFVFKTLTGSAEVQNNNVKIDENDGQEHSSVKMGDVVLIPKVRNTRDIFSITNLKNLFTGRSNKRIRKLKPVNRMFTAAPIRSIQKRTYGHGPHGHSSGSHGYSSGQKNHGKQHYDTHKGPHKHVMQTKYKGPQYGPYDLIAPFKSKGGGLKYGTDPVIESYSGIYHGYPDGPIKHFGGFGGGGSVGYNAGSLKSQKGHGGYGGQGGHVRHGGFGGHGAQGGQGGGFSGGYGKNFKRQIRHNTNDGYEEGYHGRPDYQGKGFRNIAEGPPHQYKVQSNKNKFEGLGSLNLFKNFKFFGFGGGGSKVYPSQASPSNKHHSKPPVHIQHDSVNIRGNSNNKRPNRGKHIRTQKGGNKPNVSYAVVNHPYNTYNAHANVRSQRKNVPLHAGPVLAPNPYVPQPYSP